MFALVPTQLGNTDCKQGLVPVVLPTYNAPVIMRLWASKGSSDVAHPPADLTLQPVLLSRTEEGALGAPVLWAAVVPGASMAIPLSLASWPAGVYAVGVRVLADGTGVQYTSFFVQVILGAPQTRGWVPVLPAYQGQTALQDEGPEPEWVHTDRRLEPRVGLPRTPKPPLPYTTRLPRTALWYDDVMQPIATHLYHKSHVFAKNARGDTFSTAVNTQGGEDLLLSVGPFVDRQLFRDGPRGIGYATSYTTIVPSRTNLNFVAFVEHGLHFARFGMWRMTGDISTIVGFRLKRDVLPYNPNDVSIPWQTRASQYAFVGTYTDGVSLSVPTDCCQSYSDPHLWYIADMANHRLAVVNALTHESTTYAGRSGQPGNTNGPAAVAQFREPISVDILPDGSLIVADRGNNAVRQIAPDGTVSTLLSDIPSLHQVRYDSQGRLLILCAQAGLIHRYDPVTDRVTQVWKLTPGVWRWMAVNRDGTCGPVDDVFLAESIASLSRITNDFSSATLLLQTGGYVRSDLANVVACNHYPWTVACANGRIFVNGFGTEGMGIVRQKTPDDVLDSTTTNVLYSRGRSLWFRRLAPTVQTATQPGHTLLHGRHGVMGLLPTDWRSRLSDLILFGEWLRGGADGFTPTAYSDAEVDALHWYLLRHLQLDPVPTSATPPLAPTGLAGMVVSERLLYLNWDPATEPAYIQGYAVYRDDVLLMQGIDPTTPRYADHAVQPGRTYSYAVEVTDNWGQVARCAPLTVSTPGEPVVTQPVEVMWADGVRLSGTLTGTAVQCTAYAQALAALTMT